MHNVLCTCKYEHKEQKLFHVFEIFRTGVDLEENCFIFLMKVYFFKINMFCLLSRGSTKFTKSGKSGKVCNSPNSAKKQEMSRNLCLFFVNSFVWKSLEFQFQTYSYDILNNFVIFSSIFNSIQFVWSNYYWFW